MAAAVLGDIPGSQPCTSVADSEYICEIFSQAATVSSDPIVGNIKSMCQRLEGLTNVVGKQSETLATTIPELNIALQNNDAIGSTIVQNMEAKTPA